MSGAGDSQYVAQLRRTYLLYAAGVVAFVLTLAVIEALGVPNSVLGYLFMLATMVVYAGIGFMSKTADVAEYYVAGRRVPAVFNGMAIAADWMSAASFLGLAGTLYQLGYDGLAYIMGWTGGYCLVALLLAPYLRRFGHYTIPDFIGARYGGSGARLLAVFATVLVSFTYVVAQIYGVGLITSRLVGLDFTTGVFVGLAGMLVCSFLGGMKAVTWTQVAQYIILIVAYLTPVVWLSVKHTGNPVPQIAAYTEVLPQVTALEAEFNDPATDKGAAEHTVRQVFVQRADRAAKKLASLEADGEGYLQRERRKLEARLATLKSHDPLDSRAIEATERELRQFPDSVDEARKAWSAAESEDRARAEPLRPHAQPFQATVDDSPESARINFLALVFCLMVGTAGLPHILARFYTTPSVSAARRSVFWSMFFILLLYLTAPALAILVKYEVYHTLVGTPFAELPAWVSNWQAVDQSLLFLKDVNGDGLVQRAEISIGGDIVVLAMPEIAGLPYVVTGLVAAGGLAAALSTADGLLLTIANSLSHDVYYKVIAPDAPASRRLVMAKAVLLVVAVLAAYATSLRPGNILVLVGAAFSLAASALFPALVCAIFWTRATRAGAILGIASGMLTAMYYIIITYPLFGINASRWWGIAPIAAGVFGVPAGFVGIVVGSWLSRAPDPKARDFVARLRVPPLRAKDPGGAAPAGATPQPPHRHD